MGFNRYDTESFIKKAKLIHGDIYDYSLVEYKKIFEKIIIICKSHGKFLQTPDNHINGKKGCNKCGEIRSSKKQSLTKEEFVNRSKKIHGDKYDYSLVNYINANKKVKIICPMHGDFEQTPVNHLYQNKGCNKCGNIKSGLIQSDNYSKQFIQRAVEIHNDKYDYSLVKYKTCKDKVIIICKKHGEFSQTPDLHLNNKSGCLKCAFESLRGPGHPLWKTDRKRVKTIRNIHTRSASAKLRYRKKYNISNDMTIDHIIPIAKFIEEEVYDLNIINDERNFQALTRSENSIKGSKCLHEDYLKYMENFNKND